ncbi:carboxylating nicotinate-nucleotide diphosphorylase [Aciduricibacillus chroicocephali]|uniref:nicotinate-nucleotide diphosphorylase (carboxylating) n=1 Tax=Aciduricibacillus chroicocephali TaxID=3054939 RepID=A0ABY9KV68_9BACI|nr:carboxylating nicotinate-nucleotide diphosphorylase [Bacillaceae bacterium 44XB]
MNLLNLRTMLKSFLLEDIGSDDLTSSAIFPPNLDGEGYFAAKEHGILAGSEIIRETYQLLDPSIRVELLLSDGSEVKPGDKIACVFGPIRQLLSGERVILNLMQRMSGIATLTKECVEILNDPSIRILDTRKTTPGLRMLEKYAVRVGGGWNHRFGLYDGIMIKDNHIAFCGSITEAVHKARSHAGHMVKIEVETESSEQVEEAVAAGADVIMFDNQPPESVRELVKLVPEHIWTEASGGINPQNLASYRNTGVNGISLGALTHSVRSLDISFLEKGGKPHYKKVVSLSNHEGGGVH